MRTLTRLNPRGVRSRPGAAATELAIIMPVLILLTLGCIDFGRLVNSLIAITNAARAGVGIGIMSRYPDPDPSTGTGLANWQKSVCDAVANELGDRSVGGRGGLARAGQWGRGPGPGRMDSQ